MFIVNNFKPIAYRVIFHAHFCRLLILFKINFFAKSFKYTIRVFNSLDPDQARLFVGPDLGPNCLQRLSADDTSRQSVLKRLILCLYLVVIK